MRYVLAFGAVCTLCAPAFAEGPSFTGASGLLLVPTAEVLPEGTAQAGGAQHDPPHALSQNVQNYFVSIGLLPGLEVGGRLVEDNFTYDINSGARSGQRDLSFNARYRLNLPYGVGVAVGGEDIGGEVQNYRTSYAVATVPLRSLAFTFGYGRGPDVLEGAFGGIEWRPWEYLGLVAEYDTEEVNGGVKLRSPELIYGLRLGAVGAYRGVSGEIEYGAHLEFPLGRPGPSPAPSARPLPADAGRGEEQQSPSPGPSPARSASDLSPQAGRGEEGLRGALTRLGFESVRLGRRGPATQVVALENRSYNQSSADGIGLALGVIAARADPAIEQIELTLLTYGVPHLTVTAPAALYRAFLADPAARADELRQALVARPVSAIENESEVAWDPDRVTPLTSSELVIEPLLRTFIGTEYGVLDYALGARVRWTAPIARGLLLHAGAQVPVTQTGDFDAGQNFYGAGLEAGPDLALVQYVHKLAPQWTWLWSAGRSQVYRVDLNTLALEQGWLSDNGQHLWRTKFMGLHSSAGTRSVALAGYTWFDPARDYSVSLTAGRFYTGEGGFRVELNRWFGDTQCGLFFKAASWDDQAGGMQISLPLTPRRDANPRIVQIKGSRRWGHSLSSTLNGSDQRNPLRPLLLYEPTLDLDLRRDFYDSGRLGEAYLRDELPRMHEAYELWGTP